MAFRHGHTDKARGLPIGPPSDDKVLGESGGGAPLVKPDRGPFVPLRRPPGGIIRKPRRKPKTDG